MKVRLSDIIDALMSTNQDSVFFFDKKTDKVEWVSDMAMTASEQQEIYDLLDAHGFYRLPTQFEIRDYDIMEEFADTLSGEKQARLYDALRGRGAFRHFKDTVIRMEIAQKWYDYHDKAYKQKAVEWCEENDIDYAMD